jgi:hypothetical protein
MRDFLRANNEYPISPPPPPVPTEVRPSFYRVTEPGTEFALIYPGTIFSWSAIITNAFEAHLLPGGFICYEVVISHCTILTEEKVNAFRILTDHYANAQGTNPPIDHYDFWYHPDLLPQREFSIFISNRPDALLHPHTLIDETYRDNSAAFRPVSHSITDHSFAARDSFSTRIYMPEIPPDPPVPIRPGHLRYLQGIYLFGFEPDI